MFDEVDEKEEEDAVVNEPSEDMELWEPALEPVETDWRLRGGGKENALLTWTGVAGAVGGGVYSGGGRIGLSGTDGREGVVSSKR